ncbi:hypothetical protein ABIC65_001092 [Sphingomonas trueperi]|uniref:hypothetical protein n=1 Tax=Sphingomonas trueperi TaxID=53317 RepID=UPI003395333C
MKSVSLGACAAALVLLSGCGPSAGELAEREYRVVDQPGSTMQDKCQAARKVAAAYLGTDEAKYRNWQMKADLDCLNARVGM